MLKAWEAMRLGKDAQIAALMERCKRHEEEAAEKARTVEALRNKVSAVGRELSSSASTPAASQAADSAGTGLGHPRLQQQHLAGATGGGLAAGAAPQWARASLSGGGGSVLMGSSRGTLGGGRPSTAATAPGRRPHSPTSSSGSHTFAGHR